MKSSAIRRWMAASFVAAAAVVAIGYGSASAGTRPFEGSAVGVVTGSPSPGTLEIDYTGNAPHLGPFTRHETVTIGDGGTLSGTITFFARNGDELDCDLVGQFITASPPFVATGTYTFTQTGTGRFADATGSATFTATTSDFVNVSVSFDGTIDY